ncbi:MAG: hypothetical protein AAGN35_14260 [Bacteroidota bacterium]
MRRFLILMVGTVLGFSLSAQDVSGFPLEGKTVAVYFSKKQFVFDSSFRIPLSQFILSDKGEDAPIEDIKTQTLISLGTLFSEQLQPAAQADSVYFLNEFPAQARAFIANYDSENRTLGPTGEIFAGTDYILVVNPFVLGSYTTSAVYTRSNRLITEKVMVKTGRVRIEIYDAAQGNRVHSTEVCIDERKTAVPDILFEFHMRSSRTGNFLARLFSLAIFHLNYRLESNCETVE